MKPKTVTYLRMPIKGTPYKHQRAAFEFACRLFGLADKPGNAQDNDKGVM
jgi:hypothetical protein